jgi:hypothetical protein
MRFAAWIGLIVLILAGNDWLIRQSSKIDRVPFIIGWVLVGTAVVAMAALLATTPATAIRVTRRAGVVMVLCGAALLQARGLFHVPWLSQDMARYHSDGRMWSAGVSPYQISPREMDRPAARHGAPNPLGQGYGHVPHPMLRTIYPPLAQAWFCLVEWAQPAGRLPGIPPAARTLGPGVRNAFSSFTPFGQSPHAALYRIGAGAFAIGTTALLLLCLHRLGRSPWYAALFGWSPLTVIESAGQGHIDIIGAFFIVLALTLTMRGRLGIAATAVALAAGIKPQAAVVLPFVAMAAWHPGGGRRRSAGVIAVGLIALIVVYSPLLLSPGNWQGWRETTDVYAMSWEANGSIYELITAGFRGGDGRALEEAKLLARVLAAVGTFIAFYLCVRNRLPPTEAAYWLALIPLLLAPVVYPWYLLWGLAVVPLLTRTGGWTMLAWAATSGLSYHLWQEPQWSLSWPWALAEYAPVYLALAVEVRSLATSPRS